MIESKRTQFYIIGYISRMISSRAVEVVAITELALQSHFSVNLDML